MRLDSHRDTLGTRDVESLCFVCSHSDYFMSTPPDGAVMHGA